MGRTASSIFEGSRDEDHLAFVSLAFSPVVDAFLAKGPRVIALEVVPRRMVSLVRSRVPFLAFLSRGLTRCYHPGDDGPSHLPLLGLTLTLLRLQVSHPLYFPGTPTMLISTRSWYFGNTVFLHMPWRKDRCTTTILEHIILSSSFSSKKEKNRKERGGWIYNSGRKKKKKAATGQGGKGGRVRRR